MEQDRASHPIGEVDEADIVSRSPQEYVAASTPPTDDAASTTLDLLAAASNPLLERMSEAFFALDREWRLTYLNAAAEHALGCQRAAVLGVRLWEALPALGKAPVRARLERAVREGSPVAFKAVWRPPPRQYIIRAYPDPATGSLAVYFREQPTRTRRVPRANKLRYHMLFDLAPVAVYSCDAHGVIQECNQLAIELWGRAPKRGDMRERYCGSFKLYYPDGSPMPHKDCPLARALRGEVVEERDGEILVERPDGVRRQAISYPHVLRNARGNVVGAISYLYDITERKRAEDALRAANRRMDEFLHSATHELKTPLTALQATLELAERRIQRLLAPVPDMPGVASEMRDDGEAVDPTRQAIQGIAQLLDRTLRQVQRQTRLVNDLVDATRIQTNKLELRLAPCDLALIVREAVAERRAVRPERTIQLLLAEGVRVPVEADADRIDQVITNFLTNALKFSAADRPIEVALRVEGATARVAVRDEGPGIPAEAIAHIWDVGYHVQGVEPLIEGVGLGLGLGLPISRSIVERHGGQVGLESTPGQGSTFWFALRLASK